MGVQREERIGDCRLILGDCLEVMPHLERVDAVVTDPPYGIGFKYNSHKDTPEAFQAFAQRVAGMPCALLQYPEEMMRLACPIMGAPDEVLTWVYGSNLPRQTRLWGFWGCDVDPSRSKQAARNPECAKVKNLIVSGYDWREIPQVKNTTPEKTEHPCQVSVSVMNWVLECLRADTILDPFMGSGTTLVACAKLGRKGIGIELDPDYFDIACKRVEEAYRQPDLFVEQPKAEAPTTGPHAPPAPQRTHAQAEGGRGAGKVAQPLFRTVARTR